MDGERVLTNGGGLKRNRVRHPIGTIKDGKGVREDYI